MKSIILSAISFVAISASSYGAIEVQVDQIKTAAQPVKTTNGIKNGQNPTNSNPTDVNAPKGTIEDQKPVDVIPDQKSEPFIKDHDLTKAIYDAIRSDRLFLNDSKQTIQVTVFNGKVTLSGIVKTEAEKKRAEFLATQINKLNKVTNDIKVIQ